MSHPIQNNGFGQLSNNDVTFSASGGLEKIDIIVLFTRIFWENHTK